MESFSYDHRLQTPVLFIAFNRPELTKKVFDVISLVAPPRLYIAVDGPRVNNTNDVEKIAQIREMINDISWECELHALFRENNLGCRLAVSESITWFFNQECQGIILEDDCVPSQQFFWFCEKLLERYREQTNVWHISGANLNQNNALETYHFSAYPGVWGWATWADRWKSYDVKIADYGPKSVSRFASRYGISRTFWSRVFAKVQKGEIDTWDFQWIFTIWSNSGLCVTPNKNMVSNIGFGEHATHTKNSNSRYSNVPAESVETIHHPSRVSLGVEYDKELTKHYFSVPNPLVEFKQRLLRLCSKICAKYVKN